MFGSDVSLDDAIIPARFAAQRVTDPAALAPHLFENIDPEFASRAQPGDIVLGGANFACGKPRLQGFIAMRSLDLSVVCTSMPFKMLRRAVARAIPVIVGAPAPEDLASTGDEIEIDYAEGMLTNNTRNLRVAIPAMPPILQGIVSRGGAEAILRDWLLEHPEQGAEPAGPAQN